MARVRAFNRVRTSILVGFRARRWL